jgi:hypothetical protein
MSANYPIADMHVFPLRLDAGRLVLLREADHLLRRFGQLELLDLAAGAQTEFQLRAEADRFFFVIAGRAALHLLDLRAGSPSHGAQVTVPLDGKKPQGVLVPFGVACGANAELDSRLIVLSTHSETHPDDRLATADELQKYAAIQ